VAIWRRWRHFNLGNMLFKIMKFWKIIMFYSETENDGVVLILQLFRIRQIKLIANICWSTVCLQVPTGRQLNTTCTCMLVLQFHFYCWFVIFIILYSQRIINNVSARLVLIILISPRMCCLWRADWFATRRSSWCSRSRGPDSR
jgi:hypothetical protein